MKKKEILLSSKIQPIPSNSLTDLAQLKLLDFFRKENLKPGDKIPKEIELSEALNVSRTVVREVLSRLRTLGMIESKKRFGMILSEPDILIGLEKLFLPDILLEETLRDMFELRLVLEMGIAELVFARKNDKFIKELKTILKHETDNEYAPNMFLMEFEARFHGKIYQMTGNKTLQRFQNYLLPIFKYTYDKGLYNRDNQPKNYITHAMILQAIEHGTPETYRIIMRKHLKWHFNRILGTDNFSYD